ncbi:MAG: restriction endonuclease subunit S [Hormoscilla sp. SP5CHS1]|nr:restriction endonuclease subunit S [Hormoscilla sp. SP5CHS1]
MSNHKLAIDNSQVPEGYKKTEVGVIPEDWDVASLVDVSINGGLVRGPFGGALKKEFFVKSGYKVYEQRNAIYRSIEIGNYFIDSKKFNDLNRFEISEGDIIVSCSGTIGCIYKIPEGAPQGVINQALLKITLNNNLIDSNFFLAVFCCDKFQEKITENSHGGAMQNLVGMDTFKNTLLQLPPLPEQRAIAQTLSDVDALIAALDKLITKKRNIKTATMQQLLTGKKRLSGFSDEWHQVLLGELGVFSKGSGIKKDDVLDYGFACIRYGEIYTKHHDFIKKFYSFISEKTANNSQVIKSGDLLFAGSGETAEEIGKCVAFLKGKIAYAGGDIVIFSPKEQDSMFLGYLMNYESIVRQKARMGQGDAVVHIQAKNLAQLQFDLPPLEEQRAIASILSDIDAEIAALEKRRAKTKAIKQGMMEQLLTGKTRLIVPSNAYTQCP